MESKTIFISAGHSNQDPGIQGSGLKESDITTELRDLVIEIFKRENIKFVSDGTGLKNMTLADAIELAKVCSGPRVELHANGGPSTATGVECFSSLQQRYLAQDIAKAIAKVLGTPLRGTGGWKPDTESNRGKLGFVREADGIIVEVFFLTNKLELEKYLAKRAQVAESIAEVLIKAAQVEAPAPRVRSVTIIRAGVVEYKATLSEGDKVIIEA